MPDSTTVTEYGRILLKYAVQHAIFCPITGQVLDVRDAVVVDANDYGGVATVVSGPAWDAHSDLVTEAIGGTNYEVYDGRVLMGDPS